jgi:hypothetical protein
MLLLITGNSEYYFAVFCNAKTFLIHVLQKYVKCLQICLGHIERQNGEFCKSGSVLRFQEEETKIEVTLLLSSHVLLGLHCKQYTSDLHIKLLQAFPLSLHPIHTWCVQSLRSPNCFLGNGSR